MNADCPGKSLNERLQYACNLSNDLYESARFFQGLMNEPYETPYVWLNDPKTVKKGYDYLWKRLDAVGGVSLWDLSPAEMMQLQKMVAEEPTGMFDCETHDKIINTLVSYAEGSQRKDTLSERGYILTTTDLEVLHDRREEIDSKSGKEKVEETLKNIGKTVVYLVSAGVIVGTIIYCTPAAIAYTKYVTVYLTGSAALGNAAGLTIAGHPGQRWRRRW